MNNKSDLRSSFLVLAISILIVIAGCQGSETQIVTAQLESLRELPFDEFVDESYRLYIKRFPEYVTMLGMDAELGLTGDQLNDISPEFIAETQILESGIYEHLPTYDRNSLTEEQQVIYDIYAWCLDDLVRGHDFTYKDYPINTIVWSMNVDLTLFFTDLIPVTSLQEAENYISRLEAVKLKFDQLIENLQLHEETGVVLPVNLIKWILPDLLSVGGTSAKYTDFYASFSDKLETIPGITQTEKGTLLEKAAEAIDASVIPAFKELYDYFQDLQDRAPEEIGVGHTPDGRTTYEYFLRHFTTSELTVEEVHQLGLDGLEQIHDRMRQVFNDLGYTADASLANLYRQAESEGGTLSGQAIYDEHVRLIEYAKELTGGVFNLMPQVDVIVVEDPVGGFYSAPPLDGSRPGMFYAQISGNSPRMNLPSLTFHETIPGHHYQFAIIPQLNLPLFQVATAFDGYTEGWALYAEQLMWELGAYENDPYGELGYLRYQALRAARLVIDTGINALNWTYDEAVNFLQDNAFTSRGYSQYEVARAATVPGQSSSYYLGFLTILDLRQQVQEAWGEAYSLKTFHDLILRQGAVPLAILEQIVQDFIQSSQK